MQWTVYYPFLNCYFLKLFRAEAPKRSVSHFSHATGLLQTRDERVSVWTLFVLWADHGQLLIYTSSLIPNFLRLAHNVQHLAHIATSTEYAQTASTFLLTITLSCLSLLVPPSSSSPFLRPLLLWAMLGFTIALHTTRLLIPTGRATRWKK
jgi:hypothetical protein